MRRDTDSQVIHAPARAIYRAFLAPYAVAAWRPPDGMTCVIDTFQPREGGMYRMAFVHSGADHETPGKTSQHEDVFRGRFVKLVPNESIVEEVEFESGNPAFAGTMTITTTLVPVPGGTRVTFVCENVPPGIKADDHRKGMLSSLENLAAFLQRRSGVAFGSR